MIFKIHIFLLLVVYIFYVTAAPQKAPLNKSETLKHVFAVFKAFKHDPFDYPGGPNITGKLESSSKIIWPGIEMAYQSGVHLASLYGVLFGIQKWSTTNYKLIAPGQNWIKHSALVVAAGLQKNKSGMKDNWTTEEMKIIDKNVHYGNFFDRVACPRYFEYLNKTRSKLKKDIDNIEKIQGLRKHQPDINTTVMDSIWLAYETYIQKQSNRLPWVNKNIMKLKQFSQNLLFNAYQETQMKILSGGPILENILNEIDSLVKGKSQHMTQPIMTIISLPQIQFVALLSTFFPSGTRYLDKPMDPIYFYPDEGAKLMIELHQQKNQTYGIKVYYSSSECQKLAVLKIPLCDSLGLCDYKHFSKVLEEYKISEMRQKILCTK